MNESPVKLASDDELSLIEAISILWGGRWLILSFSVGGALIAGVAAFVVPKSYTATTIVVPVSSNNGGVALGGLGAIASQFGGLASLAGVAVPGESKKNESLAVLQSEALTEKYIADHALLQIIFRKRWDAVRNKWKSDDPAEIPTLWEANEYFKKKIRSVSNDTKAGVVTISITWTDPKLAASWANDIVRLTNLSMRNKEIAEAEANIAYLNDQAIKSDVLPIKQGIYAMLQNEISKVMVAKGSEEFALKVVDPAVVPQKAISPQPVIWVLFGLLGGLLLSCIIVFYRPNIRTSR